MRSDTVFSSNFGYQTLGLQGKRGLIVVIEILKSIVFIILALPFVIIGDLCDRVETWLTELFYQRL